MRSNDYNKKVKLEYFGHIIHNSKKYDIMLRLIMERKINIKSDSGKRRTVWLKNLRQYYRKSWVELFRRRPSIWHNSQRSVTCRYAIRIRRMVYFRAGIGYSNLPMSENNKQWQSKWHHFKVDCVCNFFHRGCIMYLGLTNKQLVYGEIQYCFILCFESRICWRRK